MSLLSSSRRGAAACYPPSVAARDHTRAHRCIGSAEAFSVLTRRGCCLHTSPRQMLQQAATTPDVDKIPRSHFPLPHAALLPLLGTSFTRSPTLPPYHDSTILRPMGVQNDAALHEGSACRAERGRMRCIAGILTAMRVRAVMAYPGGASRA